MRRRLLNLVTAGSLLLSVTATALWLRSYWACDYWFRNDERMLSSASLWTVASGPGAVWLYHEGYDAHVRQNLGPALYGGFRSQKEVPPVLILSDLTYFDLQRDESDLSRYRISWNFIGDWRHGAQLIICPYWCLLLVTMPLPARWFLRSSVRRYRRKRGKCPACAYDLTGNLSGVCPECGAPTTESSLAGGLARRSAAQEFQ